MSAEKQAARLLAPLVALLLPLHTAAAQSEGAGLRFEFNPGGEYNFGGDVGGNSGDFSILTIRSGLTLQTALTRDLDMAIGLGYQVDDYDFDDPGLNGRTDPWDDVHTITLGARFTLQAANDWTIFGGPIFAFALESGADWGDAFTGGGMVGATVRLNDDLLVGGGFGIMSEIEDDPRFFPVIVLHWTITEELTLRNSANGTGRAGIELAWKPGRSWEFALGAGYDRARFRLDDDAGAFRDGVGETTGVPMTLRATYTFNENIEVSGYVGFVFNGNLRLEDSGGGRIADEDYDPAPFLGLSGTIRF